MPLLTQPNAAARVYARSFFDLALAKGGREHVETLAGELEDVVELTRTQAGFGELLSNPGVTTAKRAASLTRILQGRVSDETYRFVQVLNAKGRLNALPAVAAALDEVVQEKFGRVEVDVFTAQPVSSENLAPLKDRLARALAKDVVVHPYTDPSLIGGVKVRIGDQLIDASLATRLRKMKDKLARDGEAALRSRMGRALDG